LLPKIFNQHKSAIFDWYVVKLLRYPMRYIHHAKRSTMLRYM